MSPDPSADPQDPRPKHNPGEPEFGPHDPDAPHNPGEFEFGEKPGPDPAEQEQADAESAQGA